MKTVHWILIVLSATACLQACSLVPKYEQPGNALPESIPESWPQEPLATVFSDNAGWWEGFRSKALPLLQQEGVARNLNLSASGWRLAQAVAQSRVARSPLFPWLGATGSGSRKGAHVKPTGQHTDTINVADTFSGGFQASYELDIWGRLRSQADAAAFMAEATLDDWRSVGLSLESNIAVTYFQLLALRERLAVQRDILSTAQQTLDYIEKQQRAGAASALDLARQRSDVESMKARTKELERQMSAARNALNDLLGTATTPEGLDSLIAEDSITKLTPPAVVPGLPSSLLLRRPDILKAEASLKAANANIGAARAAFLPVVNLVAQGGWQSDELHSLFRPTSTLYSVAASFVTPIFQGGRLTAQHDAAVARKEELIARYQQTVLSAFLEIDTAIAANGFLAQEEADRGASVRDAREADRIVHVQYREGSTDFLSLLDAQRTLLTVQDARISATLARLNTTVGLFKALGGGWGERLPPNAP
ncbi:efflux transporter outer membrane subunit [Pseudodesulfovibrio indicus]|uniref:NodT family efflux transporter outer membrane factor (OMF) lipoprotein n=1 Tax=Pseudodesulfovibrio indicus TaxID=1716143 RepID=A0A126QM97_9BACT|nr:efflux transporter outer membrane subunit [Pseudodesulfovibrio indicus]AMK11014.1 hypothetical protein AWY79_07760 [Pseudodesulfovibrio indicus]TDT92017.1 NodT family efflux transporter outer membrane factor (OMF) lipoprotein [Pseudodesulfovibrio indicus]